MRAASSVVPMCLRLGRGGPRGARHHQRGTGRLRDEYFPLVAVNMNRRFCLRERGTRRFRREWSVAGQCNQKETRTWQGCTRRQRNERSARLGSNSQLVIRVREMCDNLVYGAPELLQTVSDVYLNK